MNRYGSEGPGNAERRVAAKAKEEATNKTLKLLLETWGLKESEEQELSKAE